MTTYEKTGSLTSGTVPPESATACLDTNLVSGLARQHLKPPEVGALFQLVELMHEGRLRLVTSEKVTREEIDAVPAEHRAPHEGIYALLPKIPAIEEQRPFPRIIQAAGPGRSRLIQPAVVQEEDIGKLRQILPDENDARHVFQAIKNRAAYFVTADERTILAYAREIEEAFPIRIVRPSQLVAELTAAVS